jgi:hypothetical protein
MGEKRDKLKDDPNPPQLLRNANLVVRVAGTTERSEPMEKPSKNRDEEVGTSKPMNTNTAIPREVQS